MRPGIENRGRGSQLLGRRSRAAGSIEESTQPGLPSRAYPPRADRLHVLCNGQMGDTAARERHPAGAVAYNHRVLRSGDLLL